MPHAIQQGLTYERGTRPPACYRLVLLNAAPGAKPTAVATSSDEWLSPLFEDEGWFFGQNVSSITDERGG